MNQKCSRVHSLRSGLVFGETSRERGYNSSDSGAIVLNINGGPRPGAEREPNTIHERKLLWRTSAASITPNIWSSRAGIELVYPPRLASTYLLRPWAAVFFLVFLLQRVTFFLRCVMLSETLAVRGAPPPPPPVCSLTSIWRRRWCRRSPAAEPSGWSRLSVWSLLKTEVAKSIHILCFSISTDNYVKKKKILNSCNQVLCYFLYFNFSLYWKCT